MSKEQVYYNDYETVPTGEGNPHYECAHCGVSAPEINGKLENHYKFCSYRIKKEKELGLKYVFSQFLDTIENWDGSAITLIEDERYVEFRNKLEELISK